MKENLYLYIQKEVLIPVLNDLYSRRGDLAETARNLEKMGMKHAKNRLAELRSGKRNLTFFYLRLLMNGGVMTVNQILKKRKIEELSEQERDIILRLRLSPNLLNLLYEAEKAKLDVEQLLKVSLKK